MNLYLQKVISSRQIFSLRKNFCVNLVKKSRKMSKKYQKNLLVFTYFAQYLQKIKSSTFHTKMPMIFDCFNKSKVRQFVERALMSSGLYSFIIDPFRINPYAESIQSLEIIITFNTLITFLQYEIQRSSEFTVQQTLLDSKIQMKNQRNVQETIINKEESFQTAFLNIFNHVVSIEEELDTLRELLNEEISFNLKDLYVLVASNSTAINFQHVLNFIGKFQDETDPQTTQKDLTTAIQSFIKFYNGNTSLNLSFTEFSALFLNRQNRLLMKMTLERDSIGVLPNYVLSFSRKILLKEIQLHLKLIKFRFQWEHEMSIFIDNFITIDESINEDRLLQIIKNLSQSTPQKINVEFDIFMRYLKPFSTQKITKELFNTMFLNVNVQNIKTFLKQKSKKKSVKKLAKHDSLEKRKKKLMDPFIRPEFHDCLTRPKVTDMFSYREIKSIQKHFNRINQSTGVINNGELTYKLKKFETVTEKNSQKVLEAIKEILWFEKQIQYSRVELSLCPDFYPVLFFDCFHRDKQNKIIPSAMQIYFKQFGIDIQLSEIYLLFKRYAWYIEGKMDFNSFCSMFDVCENAYSRIQKNRHVKSLADVQVSTKKNFLILLATIIKNEKKMDLIKAKLQKALEINLRDVFACFDSDEDGYLSITDFRVVWKKYLNLEITKEMIHLLWFRMGYHNENQLIKYEQFIKEMVPKSNSAIFQQRKLKKIKSQNIIKFPSKDKSARFVK